MDIKQYISLKIKEIRIKRGFSQKELAKYIGKTQCFISYVESGKTSLGIELIQEIADVLKFDIKLIPKDFKKK